MNKETVKKANLLLAKIHECETNIEIAKKIINWWEKQEIDINKSKIIYDNNSGYSKLVDCPTCISIMDNTIGVQTQRFEVPIEAFRVILNYHESIKNELEKEFEKL